MAKGTESRLDDHTIALIKGMLVRGDKQSDIAAWFLVNNARACEIHHSITRPFKKGENSLTTRARAITAAPLDELPPAVPLLSLYDAWNAAGAMWQSRVALEHTHEKIELALAAITRIEEKLRNGRK